MLEYQHNSVAGELWIRTPSGKKQRADNLLGEIYKKYQGYSTFYSELTSNQVNRFDTFYDCIFVETKSGSFFEKITINKEKAEPYNAANLYTAKLDPPPGRLAYNTYIDYWFDEPNNKIVFANIIPLEENRNFRLQYSFAFMVNEYDCTRSRIQTILFEKVIFALKSTKNWDVYDYILESPKITFNPTTQTYNVSFLLKNQTRDFGIISLNFNREKGYYTTSEVNGHLPFWELDVENCMVVPYIPGAAAPYRILTVGTFKTDPAYNLKFILVPVEDEDYGFVEKYLVIE